MTDGVLFGDRCERRVFFPATQAVNANNVDVIANANADASIVSRAASPNLLAALGLVAPSPYVALKCSTNSSSSSSSGVGGGGGAGVGSGIGDRSSHIQN